MPAVQPTSPGAQPDPQQPYVQPYPQQGLPTAPPVQLPPDPGAQPVDSALRLVIVLMFANLGLSVITTIITLILRNSVLSYELAHTITPDMDPQTVDAIRSTLQSSLWIKLGSTVLLAALYVWRAYSLRRGNRRAYIRLYWIGGAGLIAVLSLLLNGQYPVWMRVEQVLQGLVLISLLFAVSRKPVRDRFAKPQYS